MTALTELLEHQIAARHCPGAVVHVERAGRTVARHAVGSVHPGGAAAMHFGVRFRIASLTKPVVSLAVLMLADEGRVDLDAPVAQTLPVLRGLRTATGAPAAPTVRDLLRHTSGLAYPWEIADTALRDTWLRAGLAPGTAGLDAATFLQRLAGLPLVATPGTVFRYGYSTDVLGCLVEALDGVPLAQALRRRILAPLGMDRTGFELAPGEEAADLASAHPEDTVWYATVAPIGRREIGRPWLDSGGGGLISTLDDYAAFARLLAHGGVIGGMAGGRRLVSERLFAEMVRHQLPAGVDGPAGYCGPGFGFGLGLAVRHDGGPAAMPCGAGELAWSGISGTALFVQPREQWFALLFSANMASRMMARMAFRRALAQD
ncbi:MAG: beta-lactamase family protein [Burkholderiaceae bacterium]|nr:beta-lactamase family protein [Burkholderiaceae bacterium]